jgi:hypothetical protein
VTTVMSARGTAIVTINNGVKVTAAEWAYQLSHGELTPQQLG